MCYQRQSPPKRVFCPRQAPPPLFHPVYIVSMLLFSHNVVCCSAPEQLWSLTSLLSSMMMTAPQRLAWGSTYHQTMSSLNLPPAVTLPRAVTQAHQRLTSTLSWCPVSTAPATRRLLTTARTAHRLVYTGVTWNVRAVAACCSRAVSYALILYAASPTMTL